MGEVFINLFERTKCRHLTTVLFPASRLCFELENVILLLWPTWYSHNKRILLKIDDFVDKNSVFSVWRTKGKWLVTFIFL